MAYRGRRERDGAVLRGGGAADVRVVREGAAPPVPDREMDAPPDIEASIEASAGASDASSDLDRSWSAEAFPDVDPSLDADVSPDLDAFPDAEASPVRRRDRSRRRGGRRLPGRRRSDRKRRPGPRMARRIRRRRIVLSVIGILALAVFAGGWFLFDPPAQSGDAPSMPWAGIPETLDALPDAPGELGPASVPASDAGAVPSSGAAPVAEEEPAEAPDVSVSDSGRHQERKNDFYTFLLAGVDDGNGGSDTVIVAALDAQAHTIRGVSLPRDLKILIDGRSWKLNAAYNIGGTDLLSRTVSWQLGIPIDHTIEVDLGGFAALIDAIGGVDFEVPIDMDYDDPKQDLVIQFRKGMQHLDGQDALRVVRFRHNWDGSGYGDEDLGRMRTQQAFLKTVAQKILTPASLKDLGQFARIFHSYVDTDLTLRNLIWLGREAIAAGADGVELQTLSGTWRSPYIYADRKAALDLVNEWLDPYVEPRTADDLHLCR